MDILTFISSIFSSSAWPLTVILLSFLFRRSISKILDSIRLKRVKKGDLEFDFEHDLSQLKEKAEVVALPTKGTKSKTLKLSIQPIPGLLSIDSELQTITQINPAAGIALSW